MADHKMAFALVIVLIFAVVGGVLSLVFSNFLHFSGTSQISTTAPASPPGSCRVVYNPPSGRGDPAFLGLLRSLLRTFYPAIISAA